MLLGLGSVSPDTNLNGDLDLNAISDSANGDGGVAHGALLSRFAEQIHAGGELDDVRSEVIEAVGEAGMIDAAAVCANFNMMVRIADGTEHRSTKVRSQCQTTCGTSSASMSSPAAVSTAPTRSAEGTGST